MISLCNDWVFTQQWSDGFASGEGDFYKWQVDCEGC